MKQIVETLKISFRFAVIFLTPRELRKGYMPESVVPYAIVPKAAYLSTERRKQTRLNNQSNCARASILSRGTYRLWKRLRGSEDNIYAGGGSRTDVQHEISRSHRNQVLKKKKKKKDLYLGISEPWEWPNKLTLVELVAARTLST